MAYELIKPAKLRTDLINRTELPTQLVRVHRNMYGYGDDIDDAVDAIWPSLRKGDSPTTTKLKQQAFEIGKNEILNYLTKLGETDIGKQINLAIQTGAKAVDSIMDFTQLVKAGVTADPALGAFFGAQMTETLMSVGVSIASIAGANPRTLKQIQSVVSTTTGCVTGIIGGMGAGAAIGPWGAAAGAAAGAVVCAASAIMTALGFLDKIDPQYLPSTQARTYFAPTQAQLSTIQRDAIRLSSVLYHWYGQRSCGELFQRLDRWPYFVRGSGYASRPPNGLDGKLSWGERPPEQIAGMDPWAILQTLAFEYGGDHGTAGENIRTALWEIALARDASRNETDKPVTTDQPHINEGDENVPTALYGLMKHFVNYHDINVAAIRCGGAIGRWKLGNTNSAQQTSDYSSMKRIHQAGPVRYKAWDDWVNTDGWRTADFMPFIRFSELLHLFAAMTAFEIDTGTFDSTGTGDTRVLNASELAISRLPFCNIGARDAKYPNGFSLTSWTPLQRGAGCVGCSNGLLELSRGKDYDALLEFAFVRLTAAFSYMLMMERWGFTDVLATLSDKATGNPFERPVDPRTVVDGTLRPTEFTNDTTSTSFFGRYNERFEVFDQIRDQSFLYNMLMRTRDALQPALEAGRRAGIDSYSNITSASWPPPAVSQFVQPQLSSRFVDPTTGQLSIPKAVVGTQFDLNPAIAAGTVTLTQRARENLAAAGVSVPESNYSALCRANGGEMYYNAQGIESCRPTPAGRVALEEKCRATGGVSIWMDTPGGPQMRCLPPTHPDVVAGSGGGAAAVVGLAAVALLAFKFLR